ncbi:hypothetical protein ACQKEK_09365 [Pseudomonas sp. NPDC077408]
MDKRQFLAQADVENFIVWLIDNLPRLPVKLSFSPSRFVVGGLQKHVNGIEAVHRLYRWKSSWYDEQTSQRIVSANLASTERSLQLLSDRLLAALASGCEHTTYRACLAVLEWGGVRGAIPFLNGLRHQGQLVEYLNRCKRLFDLDGTQSLSDLNKNSILRFDAGLTKIHALIDGTGSPIYDSRVGAAIAMLYSLYRESATVDAVMSFPTGAARGTQIRDPGRLGYKSAPQFFTPSVPAERWAKSQLELGWILQDTVRRSSLFSGSSVDRCRAFEAALFMIGYDLQCLVPASVPSIPASPPERVKSASAPRGGTWVPTSVPFSQVLREYAETSQRRGQAMTLREFRQWQHEEKGRTTSTAMAYCAPLKVTEFDLENYELTELELIANGGPLGLQALLAGQPGFVAGDEREQVYMVDAFLCCRSAQVAAVYGVAPDDLLVTAGFAGRESSARLIRRVGRDVGQHFGLLEGEEPSLLFQKFYGEALSDLDAQLDLAAQALTASNCRVS